MKLPKAINTVEKTFTMKEVWKTSVKFILEKIQMVCEKEAINDTKF